MWSWCKRHVNWTLGIAIILGFSIGMGVGYWLDIPWDEWRTTAGGIIFGITMPAVVFLIYQKGRSWLWILLGFLPLAIGAIILLVLENKRAKKAETKVEPGQS